MENYEKKYKELVGKIDKAYLYAQTDSTKAVLEEIRPELKDSRNEKIRKAIRYAIGQSTHSDGTLINGVSSKEALAWLEKQGKEISWKPSKEEMDVLYSLAYITNQYDEHKEEVITRLYQDLKREFFNSSSYENMFPNTEDGVRRRSTIQVLEYARSLDTYNQYGKADIDKNIAWLEKQGKNNMGISEATKQELENNLNKALEKETPESLNKFFDEQDEHKPDDEVKPKFKVGNWIIYKDSIWKVCNISLLNYYELLKINNEVSTRRIEDVDKNARLWTIEDAKDGDALVDEDNNIGIYKEIDGIYWDSYIYLGCDGKLRGFSIGGSHKQANTRPATKEQCDALMKAMANAGYKWDAEKLELRKIEAEELTEQKSVWSKKDENYLKNAIGIFENWKERNLVMDIHPSVPQKYIDWLKSLKDRYTWKPSDVQMDALENAVNDKWHDKSLLKELLEQLKQL